MMDMIACRQEYVLPSLEPAPATERPWFVLYVKPRHEKNVAAILRGRGYQEFVPLYSRQTRYRTSNLPLFAGYVFCRFDIRNRLPVLSVPGVFSIVGFNGVATPVPDSEIEALERVIAGDLRREPWPALPVGEFVTVVEGPIQGVRGVVVTTKGTTRVIISVGLLQRSVAVEVEREWLRTDPKVFRAAASGA